MRSVRDKIESNKTEDDNQDDGIDMPVEVVRIEQDGNVQNGSADPKGSVEVRNLYLLTQLTLWS